MRHCGRTIACILLATMAGCHPSASKPAVSLVPASAPAPGGTFSDANLGILLQWPQGWNPQASKEHVLLLTGARGMTGPTVYLDVPGLPFHIPGMIPIGPVRNGYVEDMKKQFSNLQAEDREAPVIEKASARLVHCRWRDRGRDMTETGLVLVHGDRVFVLCADAEAGDEAATLAVFDEFVRSLRWIQK